LRRPALILFCWVEEIRPMMGERRVMQEALFYGFSLERHVPGNHLLRKIDRFVDLSEVRRHLEPYYSETGRPSIDPELMMRMLIVGYGFGIRSERRLCEEVHLNLAYRWFCRLGLDGDVPDHSTFSKNRHGRFRESDPVRDRRGALYERKDRGRQGFRSRRQHYRGGCASKAKRGEG
jgi:transposase